MKGVAVDVTDKNFEKEVLKSKGPVLVDFWAPWCGPCRFTSPIVEELGKEYEGKIKVVKVNVDENPVTAQKFSVLSIPTFLFFQGGIIIDSIIGAAPKDEFVRHIEKVVK
jgi:thioredoxin 1